MKYEILSIDKNEETFDILVNDLDSGLIFNYQDVFIENKNPLMQFKLDCLARGKEGELNKIKLNPEFKKLSENLIIQVISDLVLNLDKEGEIV